MKSSVSIDQTRQWSLLLIYNIYRLANVVLLLALFLANHYTVYFAILYGCSIFAYFWFALLCLYFWRTHYIQFNSQIVISGTIDIIFLVLLINGMGYIQSGVAVLLNANIAMLSILLPGRLAIFFAALASCMLLGINIFQFEYHPENAINSLFSTGIYGAGFFATAITALYFGRLVWASEVIAKDRSLALKNMQQLNEYIVERLQYGVIYVDATTEIKVINKAARQFFNLKHLKPNLTLSGLSKSLYKKYRQFLDAKKKHGTVNEAILEKPYLKVHFFKAASTELPSVLIILDDMTVLSQQVQQLKLASLGRFSASIAHELRNPLGVISHAVQLMDEHEDFNPEDRRLKQLIINNCNRMNSVIQNVLQVSRRQQSEPQEIHLSSFLDEFKHGFCLFNACEMVINIRPSKNNTVFFDKSQLEQVLVIICDNSIQHGKSTDGKVIITFSVKHEKQRIVLQLKDNGLGINPEIKKVLFEPFVSSIAAGHGMGLFIAKDICEINSAQLGFLEMPRGSCFTITFNQTSR